MKKITKSYLLNLSRFEREFVNEMAWHNKQKVSEYFRDIIAVEMQKNPDMVRLVTDKLNSWQKEDEEDD